MRQHHDRKRDASTACKDREKPHELPGLCNFAQLGPKKQKEKKNSFFKNEPGKLLETNDKLKKRTGNEAETKLPNSLKTKKVPKKRTGNEPENEAGHLVENKGSLKNEPETNRKKLLHTILPGTEKPHRAEMPLRTTLQKTSTVAVAA